MTLLDSTIEAITELIVVMETLIHGAMIQMEMEIHVTTAQQLYLIIYVVTLAILELVNHILTLYISIMAEVTLMGTVF